MSLLQEDHLKVFSERIVLLVFLKKKSLLTKGTLKGSLGRGLLFFNLSGEHLKTEQVSGN